MLNFFSVYGTASRSEYWATTLILGVLSIFVAFIVGVLIASPLILFGGALVFPAVALFAWLGFALAVRRCRDAQLPYWILIAFLFPFFGFILAIALGCFASKPTAQ